jgi:hypothetical protein
MSIKFTKHALQRIKKRNISKDEILDTINNPDLLKKDLYGNSVAQKIIERRLLRVFYFSEGDAKIVITAYKTSKTEKNTS